MKLAFDPHLTLNIIVCIMLIVAFVSFRVGFKWQEYKKVRDQNRSWKAEQDKLPRAYAVRSNRKRFKLSNIFLRFRV